MISNEQDRHLILTGSVDYNSLKIILLKLQELIIKIECENYPMHTNFDVTTNKLNGNGCQGCRVSNVNKWQWCSLCCSALSYL